MSQVPQNQGTSEIQGKPGNILCFAVVPKDSGAPELRSKKKKAEIGPFNLPRDEHWSMKEWVVVVAHTYLT
jgi:hypothetical protein